MLADLDTISAILIALGIITLMVAGTYSFVTGMGSILRGEIDE